MHVARDDCRAKVWLDPVQLHDSTPTGKSPAAEVRDGTRLGEKPLNIPGSRRPRGAWIALAVDAVAAAERHRPAAPSPLGVCGPTLLARFDSCHQILWAMRHASPTFSSDR